jgi:hypothetical protein
MRCKRRSGAARVVSGAPLAPLEHRARAVWFGYWAAALITPWACSVDPEPVAVGQQSVIYANDDRIELCAADPPVRAAAHAGVLAVIPERALVSVGDGTSFRVAAPTLAASDRLCPGERFAEQRAAAVCTAILAAPDLALTSAHCIVSAQACRTLVFAFDYALNDSETPLEIAASSLHRCAEVVAIDADRAAGIDYAWVRLDPPVSTPRSPLALDTAPALRPGTRLIAVGASQGLPLKVDPAATVVTSGDANAAYFTAAIDAFTGTSGMPLFNGDLRVAGFLMQGQSDYVERDSCRTIRRIDEFCADCPKTGERIAYLRPAVQALCAAGEVAAVACPNAAPAPTSDDAAVMKQDATVLDARSPESRSAPTGCSALTDFRASGLNALLILVASLVSASLRRKKITRKAPRSLSPQTDEPDGYARNSR